MNKNGVDDLVLLDNISETAIINTIKSRYEADLIYTYIGQVLIAVNPYRTINGLYGPNVIKNYQGRYFFEEPPHVYALAEDAYHSLLMEGVNQCIIITGESGSGKTESSKFIMQYIAAVTGKSDKVQHVKDQILESNPVLEAFGNAKTNQNYNSSRFGKYFEIQFNYDGDPTGGRITNYLLEKVRVVKQSLDERNFHIFYQLLAGGSSERSSFKLQNPEYYRYLNQSNCYTVPGVKDAEDFGRTKKAMTVIGIPESDQVEVFRLLAAILNLGNLNFKDVAKEKSTVENKDQLAHTASLFGVSTFDLEENLCNKIIARGGQRSSTYKSPLNAEQAAYSRDALAKHVYSRLFDWLVQAINNNMIDTTSEFNIGVLDIYGFEIFKFNSFEQLCINYVNEKLQQIFIELTLKSEQEEYVKEKIKWTNIDYFNNKPCVELIEKKNGVMGILDEECLFPKGTDDSLLDKLNKTCASHPHYEKPDQKLQRGCFTIKHYAGTVTYNVNSFLDKNKDDLFHNLKTMLQNSKHKFIGSLFPPEVADNKRPPSAVAQFRNQVTALVDTLMSCTPHYIRCIRPNGQKQQKNFDMTLSTNQVKYLGLLENVKVRRAGFAYRQTYDRFLHRFKMLGSKTWPLWKGEKKDGCASIMTDVNLPSNSYECGVSKIFIKAPETLFLLEEYRQRKLDDIVKIIQRVWRSYRFDRDDILNRIEEEPSLRNASMQVFLFSKERKRRTESVFRPFRGDYLGFKVNKLYAKHYTAISTKFNETKIIFADEIMKINPKFDSQKRLLVITDQALYVIGGMFSKIKRRTLIKSIDSISLSTLADNVVIFHVGSEYDFIFDTAKKTELVTVLSEHIRESSGNPPVTNFKDNVQIKVRGKKTKNITFQKDETAINPRYKKSGDTLIVSVATGLAKDAGRQERQKAVKPITRMHHINQSGKGSKAPQTKFVVKAMQAYTAKSARELSFQVGDEINVTSKDTQTGWWQGECRGKRGVFPSAYVSQIN